MSYRHNESLHLNRKRAFRLKHIAITVTVVSVVLSVGIAVDWVVNKLTNTETVVSSEIRSSVQSANVAVYRTPYYQFQATEDWVLVANESDDNTFTYFKNSGPLVTARLVFYIDYPINKKVRQNISHVLPVMVDAQGFFNPTSSVGEHCDTSWPEDLKKNPDRIKHLGIEMECTPQTQEYNILLGIEGGNDRIPITLSNSEEHTLTVVYGDLTAYPSPGDIYNIITSLRIL